MPGSARSMKSCSTLSRKRITSSTKRLSPFHSSQVSRLSDDRQHTAVQVERLAVEIARGFADLEEFLDLGVRDVEVAGGRPAAQRALRNRERERIHHAHERNDAAGLAVEPNRLADAAHRTPIGAD